MPYIKKELRKDLDNGATPQNPGELNYCITDIIRCYLAEKQFSNKELKSCYADFNDAMGALECAKHELYRRLLIPYENKKLEANGDVY